VAVALDAAAPVVDGGGDAEHLLAEREECERLRLAVEALPDAERLPLVLHYFGGTTQPEIAEFLELPLSTVKKRLRSARAHLHDQGRELMRETLERLRPSNDAAFSETIRFYLALRAGDAERVRAMVRLRPELLEVEQDWDPQLARDGVLPVPNRATPLITAVERGDAQMVALLLEEGAQPDAACGCNTGESALWTAVVVGRSELVRLLLEAGADPNARAAAGNTPLHVAAMRGSGEIAEQLVGHGADPDAVDHGGRTPVDWAEHRGHASLGEVLRSTAIGSGTGEQNREAKHRRQQVEGGWIPTGIKAIDLLAPLPRAGLVQVPLRVGVGVVILLLELSKRLSLYADRAVVWTGFAQGAFDAKDVEAGLAETGVLAHAERHLAPRGADPRACRDAFDEGIARVQGLRQSGRDVLLVILNEVGFSAHVEAALPSLQEGPGLGNVTTLLVSSLEEGDRELGSALPAPFAARLAFDPRRAERSLFPALDPLQMSSRLLDVDEVGDRHLQVATRSRELLERHAALDPELEMCDEDVDADVLRARQLIRFLTQRFLTTEPFTGQPGVDLDVAPMLDAVERILVDRSHDQEA
jgi:hypothetical protein